MDKPADCCVREKHTWEEADAGRCEECLVEDIAALEAERDKALHSARRFCAAHVGTEDPNGCPVCEIAKLRAERDHHAEVSRRAEDRIRDLKAERAGLLEALAKHGRNRQDEINEAIQRWKGIP